MPIVGFGALSVREEASVTDVVDEAATRQRTAELVYEAAKWRVARSPDSGVPLEGTDANPKRLILKIPSNKDAKSPGLLFRYFIAKDASGKEIVVVDWVRFSDYEESKAVAPDAFAT